ncbi:MAG: hypothetical protein WC837_00515 [Bellilinea sp.]
MLTEPIRVILKVVKVFEHLGINYLIGGSLASAVYGTIRATLDVDIVADINPYQVPKFVSLLQSEFYIDGDMILDAIKHVSSFNLIHLESMFKVDVFILKQRPFDLNQMQRRIAQVVGDPIEEKVYFSTSEDIILAKLDWFRAGGEVSERQWLDILGVLSVQGDRLDFNYLQKWAGILGVKDLLQKVRQEVIR